MTARRPSKPWRVIVTGPDVTAESDHASKDKAYAFAWVCLGIDSPADTAKVMQWNGGRWWYFETLRKEDVA